MYRVTLALLCGLLLAGCRPAGAAPSPTAPTETPAIATGRPTASATPLFFDHVDMMDAQAGWAWKGVSQLYGTDDGGLTWHEIHLQGKMLTSGASFLSGQEAWLPGVPDADVKHSIYHTTDGGKTWMKLGTIQGPDVELRFHDSQLGWALNGAGAAGNVFYRVYQTGDGGSTWRFLAASGRGGVDQGPMAGSIHTMTGDSLAFMPPSTIWIASGYGLTTAYAGLSVSPDGGKTWRDVNPPLPPDLVKEQPPVVVSAPQFVNEQDAFLPVRVGDRLLFFVSHDAGSSWARLSPVLPAGQMIMTAQFVNPTNAFVACGAQLCTTQDGGESWQVIATPFPFGSHNPGEYVSQFDFVDGMTGWAILMDQQGNAALLKTTDGGRTWIRLQPRLGF